MTGYALGPTVYLLLLSVFFQRQWLADAQSRGLSAQQAQHSVDAVTSSMATSPGASAYDPNLIQLASGLNLPLDYTHGLRLTMLVITLVLLTVAILACFLMPRRDGRFLLRRLAPSARRRTGEWP
jgi:MFS transporter, DHA2 family, multidrug resistance protein